MIKTIILMLFLILSNKCLSSTEYLKTDNFYNQTLEEVSELQGRDIRQYLNASYHVAKFFKFPSNNFHERVACYIGYGGKESGFAPNYVHFNVPGKHYPGLKGLKVLRFSVDYSWAGVNEQAVHPTYTVAKAIQSGQNLSSKQLRRLGMHPSLYKKLKQILVIPKSLELFRIDTSTAAIAKAQYLDQKKRNVRPSKMRFSIPYSENTQDKIDSVLIYRMIEEYDRYLRGWNYKTYDSEAYFLCERIMHGHTMNPHIFGQNPLTEFNKKFDILNKLFSK